MAMWNELLDFLTDHTFLVIATGTAILGIVSGILGSFAVLRRQSLFGDAISHAALPGIVLAFIISGSKNSLMLMTGAALFGSIATLFIMSIIKNTRIKSDSALGIVLSVFFGLGIVLLTYIQKIPNSQQAGLDRFIFGQAATLIQRDVVIMGSVGIIIVACVILFWKEFKIITFDPDYAATIGINTKSLDIFLTSLIVAAIVIGLQAVGVVLMSAMLIAPASAARQWTNKFGVMIFLSAIFGIISGVAGAGISSLGTRISTGPSIILVAVTIGAISFLFAPDRGLVAKWLRQFRNRYKLELQKILDDMLEISTSHGDPYHPHSLAILNNTKGFNRKRIKDLVAYGYVELVQVNDWKFTEKGFRKAQESSTFNRFEL